MNLSSTGVKKEKMSLHLLNSSGIFTLKQDLEALVETFLHVGMRLLMIR